MKQNKPKVLQHIVGLNIIELRKKQHMLQKYLALRLGVKPKDFSLIKSGYSNV